MTGGDHTITSRGCRDPDPDPDLKMINRMRMLFTLRDSAAMLGVSRNRVHELINSERRRRSSGSFATDLDWFDPAVCARGDGGGMMRTDVW